MGRNIVSVLSVKFVLIRNLFRVYLIWVFLIRIWLLLWNGKVFIYNVG